MDQKKTGSFLRELRKEHGITQEQFAEKLGVSARTISRWETGSNMPDISLLSEIADYYDVGIPEIIAGERKSDGMNEEALYTTGLLSKLRIRNTGWGRIPGPALKVMAFIAAFAVAALIRIVLSKIF